MLRRDPIGTIWCMQMYVCIPRWYVYLDVYQEHGANLLTEVHSGKTRNSGHKLKWVDIC